MQTASEDEMDTPSPKGCASPLIWVITHIFGRNSEHAPERVEPALRKTLADLKVCVSVCVSVCVCVCVACPGKDCSFKRWSCTVHECTTLAGWMVGARVTSSRVGGRLKRVSNRTPHTPCIQTG